MVKPADADRIREEIACALPAGEAFGDQLRVRCFGRFEVFWQGRPLMFGRRRTRELLAYLVDKNGAACTAEEIASVLWEGEADMRALKHRIRDLICDLKKTLAGIGMEAVLVRRSGQAAVRRDLLDCDYYRLLDGDANSINAFHGEYMAQYSSAERTKGRLCFDTKQD